MIKVRTGDSSNSKLLNGNMPELLTILERLTLRPFIGDGGSLGGGGRVDKCIVIFVVFCRSFVVYVSFSFSHYVV